MQEHPVSIQAGSVKLEGNLFVPPGASAVILFAHGSGSSRHSPRNTYVADVLHEAGFGTLLFDLLTADEERVDLYTAHLRFDIPLLATRLEGATAWMGRRHGALHIGYFGASTGAAAALVAAAKLPEVIKAVVSRGGRPDLAADYLQRVNAPTMMIVGGNDPEVIKLNQEAFRKLRIPHKELVIVPGATHLFEEPGKLGEVARLAAGWFKKYFK